MQNILFLNGPNLNLLGVREPSIYGQETLAQIEALVHEKAKKRDVSVDFMQSNHEGVLIDSIQSAGKTHQGLVLNAGGYTHTSIALHDAIRGAQIPTVELHLSNIHAREDFRSNSYISLVSIGVICGFGSYGYVLALDAILNHLRQIQDGTAKTR